MGSSLEEWGAFWATWRPEHAHEQPELAARQRTPHFGGVPWGPVRVLNVRPSFAVEAVEAEHAPQLRAFDLMILYASRDPGDAHHALARAVVLREGLKDADATAGARALASELADRCRALQQVIGWDAESLDESVSSPSEPNHYAQTVGPGAFDLFTPFLTNVYGIAALQPKLEEVARFLEQLGPSGQEAAEVVRKKATSGAEPWDLWTRPGGPALDDYEAPTCSPLLWSLAVVLWREVARPAWQEERDRARKSRPAIARVIAIGQLIPVMTGEYQRPLPLFETKEVHDERGRVVARIDGDAAVVAMATRGLEVLGSPVGNRLIKSLVRTAWEQHERGDKNPGDVVFLGGWSGMAEHLRVRDDPKTLQALAEAGQSVRWVDGATKGGGWWTWSSRRGGPGRPGEVRFVLGDPLRPGYALALEHGDVAHTVTSRTARRLVPELRHEPPVGVLNERSQGAAWVLHRLLLVELVDAAEDVYRAGGALLTPDDWRTMAKRAGLPLDRVNTLLAAWQEGESDTAPALLKQTDRNRWTLADPHDLERAFIEERGRRALDGRRTGKIGRGRKNT